MNLQNLYASMISFIFGIAMAYGLFEVGTDLFIYMPEELMIISFVVYVFIMFSFLALVPFKLALAGDT